MSSPSEYILYSGAAPGAESEFGRQAEAYGLQEVTFSFEGRTVSRTRGLRVLTQEELVRKDVSLVYVSKLLGRRFSNAELMRKVLQTIMYQVEAGHEVFVVGSIQEDDTVKGGTGWGAEFAKICNKQIHVFAQDRNGWFRWSGEGWEAEAAPVISRRHFTGTGTRFLEENGRKAIDELFKRSFA
ncbi:MAG: hypothetical protein EOM25_14680 [Deltaproteobacteria bacterium]|nr:hypothetical protein [Deltaproteobacteria bacterium]